MIQYLNQRGGLTTAITEITEQEKERVETRSFPPDPLSVSSVFSVVNV
jgi:hypothetical protein